MKTVSVSEAKIKLSGLIDLVNATGEEIMITKNGRPVAVLVSPEEFESLKETVAVRSNQTLMREIRRGLKSLQMKKAKTVTLEKLFE
jgi:antitoxin YefM